MTDNIVTDMEQAVELGGTVGSPVSAEEKTKQKVVNLQLEAKLTKSGFRAVLEKEREARREFYDYLLNKRSRVLTELPKQGDHRAWNKRSALIDTLILVVYWTSRVRTLARKRRLIDEKREWEQRLGEGEDRELNRALLSETEPEDTLNLDETIVARLRLTGEKNTAAADICADHRHDPHGESNCTVIKAVLSAISNGTRRVHRGHAVTTCLDHTDIRSDI